MSYDVPYMGNLKRNDTNEFIYKKERDSQTYQRMNLQLPGGRMGGKDSQEVWDGHVHTAILKWITNEDLLFSTYNSAQCYLAAWMAGETGGEWIHVYVWLSLFAVHLKLSQHCQSAIPQYKIKIFLKESRPHIISIKKEGGSYTEDLWTECISFSFLQICGLSSVKGHFVFLIPHLRQDGLSWWLRQ